MNTTKTVKFAIYLDAARNHDLRRKTKTLHTQMEAKNILSTSEKLSDIWEWIKSNDLPCDAHITSREASDFSLDVTETRVIFALHFADQKLHDEFLDKFPNRIYIYTDDYHKLISGTTRLEKFMDQRFLDTGLSDKTFVDD